MPIPCSTNHRRPRSVLPIAGWPAQDRTAWFAAIAPGSLLDELGTGAHWAPATQAGVWRAYGRWIMWLSADQPSFVDHPFADRVTPTAVVAYVADLRTFTANSSVVAHLMGLRMALGAMAPDVDWAWLKPVIARLKLMATPVRCKRQQIVPSSELLELGIKLMAESGDPEAITTWQQATQYRDGLMIALLACNPLRRKNFMAIEIGKHLVERANGIWLCFDRSETKNGALIEQPFPDHLEPYLRAYLQHVRPVLCRQTGHRDPRFAFRAAGAHLWVSKTGSALSPEVFYKDLLKRTAKEFGHSVNPHLFRDCLITQLATEDPDHIQIAALLLGHKTHYTADRYYNHAEGHRATQKHQAHVQAKRRGARRDDQRDNQC